MARSSRRRRSHRSYRSPPTQRETNAFANRRLLADRWNYTSPLSLIEDRRQWHPDPVRQPLTTASQRAHTYRQALSRFSNRSNQREYVRPKLYTNQWQNISGPIAFVDRRTIICVRRKQRREVLFAIRRTGRGSGVPRRRTPFSDIKCR